MKTKFKCRHGVDLKDCKDVISNGYCVWSSTTHETQAMKNMRCAYCLRKRGPYDVGSIYYGTYYCNEMCEEVHRLIYTGPMA